MIYRRRALLLSILSLAVTSFPTTAGQSLEEKIVSAVRDVWIAGWVDLDGVLTVASGGIYVQCLEQENAETWRCEAAALEGQAWLYHVLTLDRLKSLIAKGFRPDS